MGEKYDEKFTEDANFIQLFEAVKFFAEHDLNVKCKKEYDTLEEFMVL